MISMDQLLGGSEGYCLANPGEVYIVYLPAGVSGNGNARLNLESGKSYSVRWLDPRNGGEVKAGSVSSLEGGGSRSLGEPPGDPNLDWVAVVQ